MDFKAGETGVGIIHASLVKGTADPLVRIERKGVPIQREQLEERYENLKQRFVRKHLATPNFTFAQMRFLLHVSEDEIVQLERDTGYTLRRPKIKNV
ncbi:hypothetical protein [Veillonella sp.]|uniref:hypothetical protein n=1 Tax=Veillonella sp. TaxID=1926307 RepID=UPI002900FB5A|nr:hypothetical protein [Veillonella sp.]MDU2155140.1 hypothetical protein [Veillonella sp.]